MSKIITYSFAHTQAGENPTHKYQFSVYSNWITGTDEQGNSIPAEVPQDLLDDTFLRNIFSDGQFGVKVFGSAVSEFIDFQFHHHIKAGGDVDTFTRHLDDIVGRVCYFKPKLKDHPAYKHVQAWIAAHPVKISAADSVSRLIDFDELEKRIGIFYESFVCEDCIRNSITICRDGEALVKHDQDFYARLKKEYLEAAKSILDFSIHNNSYLQIIKARLNSEPYAYVAYEYDSINNLRIEREWEDSIPAADLVKEFDLLADGENPCQAARDYYRNFKLYEWLKSQVESDGTDESDDAAGQEKETSHKIQMLILHYLGGFNKLEEIELSKQRMAELISKLINRNPDNTRYYLTYMDAIKPHHRYNCKTKENLKFVHQLFSDLGLDEIAARVQTDFPKEKQ